MGTRSITTFIETYQLKGKKHTNKIVTMYRQFDGYPSGHGKELAEFLASGTLVNGISPDDTRTLFNGMGCLTAQTIGHLKGGKVGGIYLEKVRTKPDMENYVYEVIGDFDTKELTLVVKEVGYINGKGKFINGTKVLFKGTPQEFLKSELINM